MNDFHNASLDQYEAQQAADYSQRQSLTLDECFNDHEFVTFANEVESALMDANHLPSSVREDWIADEVLTVYKAEGTVAEAVDAIEDGYDPTPQTAYDDFH